MPYHTLGSFVIHFQLDHSTKLSSKKPFLFANMGTRAVGLAPLCGQTPIHASTQQQQQQQHEQQHEEQPRGATISPPRRVAPGFKHQRSRSSIRRRAVSQHRCHASVRRAPSRHRRRSNVRLKRPRVVTKAAPHCSRLPASSWHRQALCHSTPDLTSYQSGGRVGLMMIASSHLDFLLRVDLHVPGRSSSERLYSIGRSDCRLAIAQK